MNLARVRDAATEIERYQKALSWLNEYGEKVDKDGADVIVRLIFAGSCSGAKEASDILSEMLTNGISNFVAEAITNCRNTIAIHRQTIRDEADSA